MKKLFMSLVLMLGLVMITSYSFADQRGGNIGDRFGGQPGNSGGFHGQPNGFNGRNGGHKRKHPVHPPVVAKDVTTYVVTPEFLGEGADSSDFDSTDFNTTLLSITPDGQKTTTTLSGKVMRTFISEDNTLLAATASFPDLGKSVLYLIDLPLVQDSSALEVPLENNMASMPFISNETQQVYLTTVKIDIDVEDIEELDPADFAEIKQEAQRFLYIVGFDGTVVSKIEI